MIWENHDWLQASSTSVFHSSGIENELGFSAMGQDIVSAMIAETHY